MNAIKYAGLRGNNHWREIMTDFYNTPQLVRENNPDKNIEFIEPFSNWKEIAERRTIK